MKKRTLYYAPAVALSLVFSLFAYPSMPFCQPRTFGGNLLGPDLITSQYRAVFALATVRVDSLWAATLGPTTFYFKKLSVLSVEKFDTSIFSNDGKTWPGVSASQVSYDTSLLEKIHIDSLTGQWGVSQGDTIKNAFVLQENYEEDGMCFWSIAAGKCSFVKETSPPFPLRDALASFNGYIQKYRLPRAYRGPAGDLLPGPVFVFLPGDCGWGIRAFDSSGAWYIEHYVGGGDCPAGCTEKKFTLYKVTSGGSVTAVDSMCGAFGCPSVSVQKAPRKQRQITGPVSPAADIEVFDLFGRKLAPACGISPANHGKLPAGVYMLRIKALPIKKTIQQ
jgi:hypothetical protein